MAGTSRKKSPHRSSASGVSRSPAAQTEAAGTVVVSYAGLRALGVRYSRVHLRRLTAKGRFPAPIQLSDNRIAWRLTDLERWLASRAAPPWATPGGKDARG